MYDTLCSWLYFGLFNISQDSSTIEHEQAAGDGLYEDIDKPRKGSKNEKSEEVLADMSSVPDKSKKSQVSSLRLPSTLPMLHVYAYIYL